MGKGISGKTDKHLFNEPELSNLLLINRAISNPSKNSIDTINDIKLKKKFDMNLSKAASKIMENLTFRLPASIRPVAYNLFLHPNLEDKTFSGNVKIEFNVTDSIPFVALHSKFLNVTTNKLIRNLENGAEGIAIKNSFEYPKFEYFVVEPETTLEVGDYTIDLDFKGNLHDKIVGFYGSSYHDPITNKSR